MEQRYKYKVIPTDWYFSASFTRYRRTSLTLAREGCFVKNWKSACTNPENRNMPKLKSKIRTGSYVKRSVSTDLNGFTLSVERVSTMSDVEYSSDGSGIDDDEYVSDTSEWPETEEACLETDSNWESVSTEPSNSGSRSVAIEAIDSLDLSNAVPDKGKKRRLVSRAVSVSMCRLHMRKHKPSVMLDKLILRRHQHTFAVNFELWLSWERYKGLNSNDMRYFSANLMPQLELNQYGKFVDNFYNYEYKRLRRANVLRMIDELLA